MTRIKIEVDATVAEGTDLNKLRQRVADQLRRIGNPVREDEGITTVNHVQVHQSEETVLVSINVREDFGEEFYIGSVKWTGMTGDAQADDETLQNLYHEWRESQPLDDEELPSEPESQFVEWLVENKEGFYPLGPSDNAITVTLTE